MSEWIAWGAVLLWCGAVAAWGVAGWRNHWRTLGLLIAAYVEAQTMRSLLLSMAALVPADSHESARRLLDTAFGPPEEDLPDD